MPRFQQYHEKITFPSSWLDTAEGCFVERKKIRGIDVGILGINTAWLAQGDDKGFLNPGQSLVEEGLAKIKSAHVRIVLGHHPIDWFSKQVQPIHTLFGRANVLYLHGHLHQTESSLQDGAGEPYLSLQTGAAFQAREDDVWRNRVLWAELNADAHTLTMDPFAWNGQCQEWAVDGTAFPMRFYKNGYWVLPLPGLARALPISNDVNGPLLPTEEEDTFAKSIIDQLNRGEFVVIFAQAGRKVDAIKQKLLDVMAMLYKDAKVIHLSPALDPDVTNDRYFKALGKQAGFEACESATDWTEQFEKSLSGDQSVVLLMTNFENGSENARLLLAKALRHLLDNHSRQLKTVLFGGHALAQQVYESGPGSLLNQAVIRDLPELTPKALQRMSPDVPLEEAEHILAITGGHPGLVRECLGDIGADYEKMLNQSTLPSRLFVRYRQCAQDCDKIRGWLQAEVIRKFEYWPTDKLLRRLYWDNLLTKRNHAFVWRCELIRTWGIQQLSEA